MKTPTKHLLLAALCMAALANSHALNTPTVRDEAGAGYGHSPEIVHAVNASSDIVVATFIRSESDRAEIAIVDDLVGSLSGKVKLSYRVFGALGSAPASPPAPGVPYIVFIERSPSGGPAIVRTLPATHDSIGRIKAMISARR